jgi:Resolvase, N terminal domain
MAAGKGGGLVAWAERSGRHRSAGASREVLRFAFYGRVSTEDWQDPVTSRARQLAQAAALVAGLGVIVAEFFDVGQSRALAWACRPQAGALLAALADPGRGWDAIVIGEYERAFYGSQYAAMAPLFEHYGVQLWMHPGPHRDGHPDPGTGPVPRRASAVRVPARRCRAAPEQGARRVGAAGPQARSRSGDRAGGAVDLRPAPGGAFVGADRAGAE